MEIIEKQQTTHLPNWSQQGLHKNSFFFYLLLYKNKNLLKFGYKLSAESFRRNYNLYNHLTPNNSYIWIVNNEIFEKRTPLVLRMEYFYLRKFIFYFEQKIHTNIKLQTNLKRLPKHKEVYITHQLDSVLEVIRENLYFFTNSHFNEFKKLQIQKYTKIN